MDCLDSMCVFLCVVEIGSFIKVVDLLDMLWVMVLVVV